MGEREGDREGERERERRGWAGRTKLEQTRVLNSSSSSAYDMMVALTTSFLP